MDSSMEVTHVNTREFELSSSETSLINEILGRADLQIATIITLICKQNELNGQYMLSQDRKKLLLVEQQAPQVPESVLKARAEILARGQQNG